MPVGRRRLPADDAGEKNRRESEEAYLYTAGEGGISAAEAIGRGSTRYCGENMMTNRENCMNSWSKWRI